MKQLREIIAEAEAKKMALGHFNISNLEGLWGIFSAAKALDLPVVIGVSEGERDFVGIAQTVALVHSFRNAYSYPIYLNADHTYSLDRVKEVVGIGFDSVIIDGAELSQEENVALTKSVVEYVKNQDPQMLIEAEVGYIGKSSGMLDELPEEATVSEDKMPTGQDVKQFVQETGVDLISPAVGNIHGMLKNMPNPKLHIERIREIRQEGGVPLVLHGGSGISDDDFKSAIDAGISMIHINTEIRLAWKTGVEKALADMPDQVAPYKLLKPAQEMVAAKVSERLKLFAGK